jgi:dihydroxyacid dehydratase/phosphogluconate dehydratase
MAIGGSTNAVVHLLALAGRVGVTLHLDRFDELSRRTPLLVNVGPRASTWSSSCIAPAVCRRC